ncbi:hypothetical protein [Staphylococcus equorum]|uniref:hypothetical protein n=1 Tax=Staphylococcus equorum TaxID=246432 RepID=UPI003D80337F
MKMNSLTQEELHLHKGGLDASGIIKKLPYGGAIWSGLKHSDDITKGADQQQKIIDKRQGN